MTADRSRLTGLLRLRHLAEVTEAKGEAMAEQAPRFARLADPSSAPRVVSTFNLFQTPEPLAARLVEIATAGGRALGRVLEPSAGLGRLYRAVRAVDATCRMTLVDIAPDCCRELYLATEADRRTTLRAGDFLAMGITDLGLFDTVVMNPPFKNGVDIRHVTNATRLLIHNGGRLVSLVANGPKQRAQLRPLATEWHDLPAGSFKGEGTNVNAAIVVIDR